MLFQWVLIYSFFHKDGEILYVHIFVDNVCPLLKKGHQISRTYKENVDVSGEFSLKLKRAYPKYMYYILKIECTFIFFETESEQSIFASLSTDVEGKLDMTVSLRMSTTV